MHRRWWFHCIDDQLHLQEFWLAVLLRLGLGTFERQGGHGTAVLSTLELQVSPGPPILFTGSAVLTLLNIKLALEWRQVGSGPAGKGHPPGQGVARRASPKSHSGQPRWLAGLTGGSWGSSPQQRTFMISLIISHWSGGQRKNKNR